MYPDYFSGVGIHPMNITEPFTEETYETLKRMAQDDKVLVISEIGLDFMEGTPDRALQYHAFREQIRLARELGLPIVFHSRESHDEVLRVLREERAYEVGGVMHYFQADEATANAAIDLGFFISLARPLQRLPHLQELAARIPLEHVVLETDAAPQPFKGRRENWTEPRHLRDIVTLLAQLQRKPVEEVEAVTCANILSLLEPRMESILRCVPSAARATRP
jgi:TatD DNase family protein